MSSGRKRQRQASAGTSREPIPHPSRPFPTAPNFNTQVKAPWPRMEGVKIKSGFAWDDEAKAETEKPECVRRAISEDWDEYDTLFYNAWLPVDMRATRLFDHDTTATLGISSDVLMILGRIGLGTMHSTQYALYPDLARQFLATCRVYYLHEDAKIAQEGVLTFMCKGVRYRIPFTELCGLYGFRQDTTGVAFPTKWPSIQQFWSYIGSGSYDAKETKQTDVRHPALRYVLRLLSNTLLCKPDPTKLRKPELILLYFGLAHLFPADHWSSAPPSADLNLGAVFATHLTTIKTRAFTRQRFETVGSLITPIFTHFQIPLTSVSIISTRVVMDITYLKHVLWLKADDSWVFNGMDGQQWSLKLPNRDNTEIRNDSSRLYLAPDHDLLSPIASRRVHRGTPSSAPPSANEMALISAVPMAAPTGSIFPEPPAGYAEDGPLFRRYMVSTMRQMWKLLTPGVAAATPSASPTPPPRRRPRYYDPDPTIPNPEDFDDYDALSSSEDED